MGQHQFELAAARTGMESSMPNADLQLISAHAVHAIVLKSILTNAAAPDLQPATDNLDEGQGAAGVSCTNHTEGSEGLLAQNRELMLTLQLFEQNCKHLESENASLKEAEKMLQTNLEQLSNQHAALLGHT